MPVAGPAAPAPLLDNASCVESWASVTVFNSIASTNSASGQTAAIVKQPWPEGEFPIPDFTDAMDPVRRILQKAKSYYDASQKPYQPFKGEKSISCLLHNCLIFEFIWLKKVFG